MLVERRREKGGRRMVRKRTEEKRKKKVRMKVQKGKVVGLASRGYSRGREWNKSGNRKRR